MDSFVVDFLPQFIAALCYGALGIGAVVSASDDGPSRKARKIKTQLVPERTPKRVTPDSIKIIYMTPEEWAKVPANPYQKKKRAQRTNIDHLRTHVAEHDTVRMGVYPDGRRCKIEGHTRCDLWANRPWLVDYIPTRLRVECYPVKNDEEAAARFRRVDNRKTAKNAADDVHGAFRLRGIPTESKFFQTAAKIKSALQYAYDVVVSSTDAPGPKQAKNKATIDDYVDMFADALAELDSLDVNTNKLLAPFITAFLLAYTKHGDVVVPFFARINDGSFGRKLGKKMCPVAAIERERDKWRGGGSMQHMELTSQVLGALDTYMESTNFTAVDYRPAIDMQKVMKVDLDQYLLRTKAKRTGRTKNDGKGFSR